MIKRCNLSFVENTILTKEMLIQMNQEPKWLFFDSFQDIDTGILSGFQFLSPNIDHFSVLTKGNLLIDGMWYRMEADYKFDAKSLNLEAGRFYQILLQEGNEGVYEIQVVPENFSINQKKILIGGFKYEDGGYRRAFRVPSDLKEYYMKQALLHVDVPYYNYHGIAVCPPHLAACIMKSLKEKKDRDAKEEIIFQILLNERTVAIESLLDLLDIKTQHEVLTNEILIQLEEFFSCKRNFFQGYSQRHEEDNQEEQKKTLEKGRRPNKGNF